MISFDNVTKFHGTHPTLNQLTFNVAQGETVVLMGPSGCGKTTALRCINHLETIDEGALTVNGTQITARPEKTDWNRFRSKIGVVFQQYNLFPHLSVLENVMLGPQRINGLSSIAARELATTHLIRLGLESKFERKPANLSGGESQRVAIARALAMTPDILLFDEPTSALDPLMTAEVLDTMRDLAHQGMTLLVVTHEVGFALKTADRIVFMNQGKVLLEGTPDTVLSSPDPLIHRYFQTHLVPNKQFSIESGESYAV